MIGRFILEFFLIFMKTKHKLLTVFYISLMTSDPLIVYSLLSTIKPDDVCQTV